MTPCPSQVLKFRFGVTFEWIPPEQRGLVDRKLRVMIATEATLDKVLEMDGNGQSPCFEARSHSTRWACLVAMAGMLRQEREAEGEGRPSRLGLVFMPLSGERRQSETGRRSSCEPEVRSVIS